MEEIIREINKSIVKMEVLLLTETRKERTGNETLGNYVHFLEG